MSKYLWVYDRDPIPPIAKYRVRRVLVEAKTRYQEVGIYDLWRGGPALFLDGSLQSVESEERRYHETLVHPPMLAHPRPERVLIAGGGEGATLREALRHRTVQEVVMVDLDGELVALCRKHLASWSTRSFEDPRARLIHADARGYIERCRGRFDVILCDLPEPRAGEPSVGLYTTEFYRAVRRAMRPGGVVAVQSGPVDVVSRDLFLAVRATLAKVFPIVRGWWVPMPVFREPWGFVGASEACDPAALDRAGIRRRMAERGIAELSFLTPARHERIYRLPEAVAGRRGKVSRDGGPFTMK
jgi:spermidine synthase